MEENHKLQQIIQKLNEIEELTQGLNLGECDRTMTEEIDQRAWHLYLHLRQPGTHRTPSKRVARAYECLDESYIDLAAHENVGTAYEINREAARRIALLLPKYTEILAKLNLYPMENSEIVNQRWYDQNERNEEDYPEL